jgi:acetyl/propionyl-CoA carboxylase alpha subunit
MGQSLGKDAPMRYITTIEDREYLIEILDDNHLTVDGVVYEVDIESLSDQPVHSLIVNGKSYEAYISPRDIGWGVLLHGTRYILQVEDEREKRLRAGLGGGPALTGEYHLKSPMPGLVVSIPVSEGQTISTGDVLVILESMKMQNELSSPRDGTVTRLRVKPGDSVERRETILTVS